MVDHWRARRKLVCCVTACDLAVMNTTKLWQRWHDQHDFTAHDQNPGCHTHASGLEYTANDHRLGAPCPAYGCRGIVRLQRNKQGAAIGAQCADCCRRFTLQLLARLGYDWRKL